MRILTIRELKPGEANEYWPGNEGRWRFLVECFDTIELDKPFNLKDLLGPTTSRYRPVQTFKKVLPDDALTISLYINSDINSKPPIMVLLHRRVIFNFDGGCFLAGD